LAAAFLEIKVWAPSLCFFAFGALRKYGCPHFMDIEWLGIKLDGSAAQKAVEPFEDRPQPEPIDSRKAECPCCRGALKKIPGSKTKCPHCGEFIFVRTRPQDRSRVLVSAAGACHIAEDWDVLRDVREPDFRYLVTKAEVDSERERLRRKAVSMDPTDDEVKWALLEKMAAKDEAENKWGLARNGYMLMADFLVRRWKLADALTLYLHVCALDLNGPQNLDSLSQDLPPFDPATAFLAPAVVDHVRVIAKKLKLSMDDVRALFVRFSSAKGYPVTPRKSVEVLILALENKIDLNDQPHCDRQIRALLAAETPGLLC
jgi:hypothetical protein